MAALLAIRAGRDPARLAHAVLSVRDHRRSLAALIHAMYARLRYAPEDAAVPITRSVLEALASDAPTAGLRVGLALRGLPTAEVAPFLAALAGSEELHAGALGEAVALLGGGEIGRDPEALAAIGAALAESHDERLRRLALAVLVRLGDRTAGGWTAERLARLEAWRRDPSPLVAAVAQFTFPPDG